MQYNLKKLWKCVKECSYPVGFNFINEPLYKLFPYVVDFQTSQIRILSAPDRSFFCIIKLSSTHRLFFNKKSLAWETISTENDKDTEFDNFTEALMTAIENNLI